MSRYSERIVEVMNMRDASRHWQGRIVVPTRNRYPDRWLRVERETGVVLGASSGVEPPKAPHEGIVVVPAEVK